MRVLVCGSHTKSNQEQIERVLGEFLHCDDPITALIEGGAKHVDLLASLWADRAGIDVTTYHANWKRYGPAAGPIRNKRMLVEGKPDCVVAFPGGPGTANMVKQARAAGVRVIEIPEEPQ